MFDLCAGFVYAQVLFACVELGVFQTLASGPRDSRSLAAHWAMQVDAAERLLGAAVALRLVDRRGGTFGLGPLGAAMVDNPGIAAMIRHHAMFYADLADPVQLLREGRGAALGGYWGYARDGQPDSLTSADVTPYSALMAASQPMVAAEILDAVRIGTFRSLLDVGGGEGAFLIEAAARAPRLQLHLFDLPAVAERAAVRFAAAGMAARARITGGDMLRDALPRGADVISVVRVLHDHDDDSAMTVLRAVRAALPVGGTILVAEPMAGTSGAQRMGDAYFGFYLLAMGQGRPRSAAELAKMLREAGFARVRAHRTHTPLITGVLTGVNLT